MNLSPIFYPGRIANPTPRVPEPDFPGLATAYLRNASADEGSLTEMMKDPLLSASAGLAGYLPNHPLVELGCGVGKSALALSKLSRNQIIAIDNDPKALKIANKLKGQNFRNLRFILGDAQNLGELISDKASLIYSLQALHHFDDLDRVCDGLNSTIHPDGIVLIQDFDRGFSHLVYESRGFGISSGKIESFRKAREAGPEAFREYLSRKGDLAGKDFWINTALSVFAAYTPEEVMLKLKERNFKAGWRTPENKMSYCLVAARPEFWHRTSLHRYFPV